MIEIPNEVLRGLTSAWVTAAAAQYGALAASLRDQALDVFAAEADAVADAWEAWYLMPVECMTTEQDVLASEEILRRGAALMDAILVEDEDDENGEQ